MPQGFARAADGGLFYTETNWQHVIREPFNAVTASVFLLMALVWLARLRGHYRQNRVVVLCLLLLVVGGIGGMLYHGLRWWRVFLVMDFLPILLITLILMLWLWWRVLPNRAVLGTALVAFLAVQRFLKLVVPHPFAINVSYALVALAILTPLILLLRRTQWRNARWVAAAVVAFAIGLFFRIEDPVSGPYLAIGTHWLWHLFSATSVWWLIRYVVSLDEIIPSSARARP